MITHFMVLVRQFRAQRPKLIRGSLQGNETQHTFFRNTGAVVPVRVRQAVVQVRIAATIVRRVVQVAEEQAGTKAT